MKATEILGVDNLRFIEPSFAALTDSTFNSLFVDLSGDEGRLLIDEQSEPIALAFHHPEGWIAATFLCRNPSLALIKRFEEMNGEIFFEHRAVWAAAVRDFFARQMADAVTPAIDDLNPARMAILEDLIGTIWGTVSGETCLDCCCGSGVGSAVLRKLGYTPLSFDNDPALLCRGLVAGRLIPEETMCIDATVASAYTEPVKRGIGIMMGEINSFTKELWQRIAGELFSMTQETVITVGTEQEAVLVKDWGTTMGRSVELREHQGDPLYDRWVCIVYKS